MDHTLHYLLMADHMMLQKRLFAALRGSGLTLGQPKVLDYLKEHDGAMQKQIARGCHIEPASLSTILAGMEKRGLIARRTVGASRRNLHVFLTERGRTQLAAISAHFEEIEQAALAGFSEEERRVFLAYLMRVYENFGGER